MRCSSCESWLERYLEGTLAPARAQAVAAHLQACPACESVHRELRVVDGLLATTRPADLPPNFTFAVMAEVRALALPARPRARLWPLIGLYLAGAWLVAMAVFAYDAANRPASLASAAYGAAHPFVNALAALLHGIGPIAPIAASIVVTLLCVDTILLAAIVFFYRTIRPRLAAQLAAARKAP